tara:strand:- start:6 stop:377 length:372 start_codon:yes stop_codon:yes gene_type:complete
MRKRLKYRNIPIIVNGIKFDSKAEHKRFTELELLQKAGKIFNLEMQKDFELQPSFMDNQGEKRRSIKYIADFVYKENEIIIVEDLKSKITAKDSTYILKKKMLLWLFKRDEEYANYQFKEIIK